MSEEKIGALIASLGLDIKEFEASMEEVKNSFKRVETEAKKSSQSISKSLDKTASSMQKFGRNLSLYVTAPILGIGAAAFKAEKNFEHQMNLMVSMVGMAREEVEGMRDDVLNLASLTGITPVKLADALQFITSSGYEDAAEALEILSAAAKVAAVNQIEVKDVSDLTTSAMNAYRRSALEAKQVTDILVQAVALGKAEFDDLVKSVGIVMPVAADLNVSFQQVAGTMAMLTRTGTTTETTAVQIRQVLSQLIGPSQQALQAFKDLQWSAEDFRKSIAEKGLLPALIEFKGKIQDLGSLEMADDIFGNIRALSAVLNLTGEAMEENIYVMQEMERYAGQTDRAFKEFQTTLEYQWSKAVADGQVALIEFGETVKVVAGPILAKLSQMLIQVRDWWRSLTGEEQRSILIKAAIVAAIGPVLSILSKLIKVFSLLRTAILANARAWKVWTAAIASNPIGALITIVASAAAGIWLYAQRVQLYTQRVKQAASAQKELNTEIAKTNEELGKDIYSKITGTYARVGTDPFRVMGKSLPQFFSSLRDLSLKELKDLELYLSAAIAETQEEFVRIDDEMMRDFMNVDLSVWQSQLEMVQSEIKGTEDALNRLRGTIEVPDNSFKRLKNSVRDTFAAIDAMGRLDKLHNLGLAVDVTQEKIKYLRDTLVNLVQDNTPVNDRQIVYLIDLITQLQQELENLQQDQGLAYQSLFDEMERSFGQFDLMGKLLPGFDALGAKADWLKQKMKDLIQQGFQEGSRELEMLKWQFQEITTDIQQAGQAIANSIISNASKSFEKLNTNNFDLFGGHKQYKAMIAYIDELKQALDELDPSIEANAVAISGLEEEIDKAEKAMQGFMNVGKELSQSLGNLLGDMIEAIFSDLKDGTTIFEKLGLVIADFLQSLGRALIATGMAKIAFDLVAKNPYAAIAAGAALVALGAIVRNKFANGLGGGGQEQSTANYAIIPAFAEGGIVSGPTLGLMGEYPGAKSNPEVIAPLDKLKAMINPNPAFFGHVEFEIKGDRLVGVLDTHNRRVKSYRP